MTLRRRQRLPLNAYTVGGSTWHVTICVARQRGTIFSDPSCGQLILGTYENGCRFHGAVPHLVCVMPDHVHLLVEVGKVGLVDLIGRLKSFSTAAWWKQGNRGILWQQSFCDHGIRGPRDFEATVSYVLNNPVEAGLVAEWEDYPFIGGALIQEAHLNL